MFYRALVVGIVTFWLGMMVLLVQMEWFPKTSEALSVPTAYLWKLIFLHEEPSDLVIYYQHQRLGNLHIQPQRRIADGRNTEGPEHAINAVGGFNTDLPWIGRQNVVLHGTMGLDSHDAVQQLHLSAVFHPLGQHLAGGTTVTLEGKPSTGVWHYVVQRGDEVLREDSGTVPQLLDKLELRALGIDPAGLARMQQQQVASLSITARHGKLRMNKDDIETYVVTAKDASGLENTLHLSQLGQILAVRTFAGVDLLDGALSP